MQELNLRKGFGKYEDYTLTKFPDQSIKFHYLGEMDTDITIHISMKSNDFLIGLCAVCETLKYIGFKNIIVKVYYMMYQQDDRRFNENESFGLKIVTTLLNTLPVTRWQIFHPHSDKVEFLNNCEIINNDNFIKYVLSDINAKKQNEPYVKWIIPDEGAFKSQYKQIEKLGYRDYLVCAKSRNTETGDLEQMLVTDDLKGQDCVIFDDIVLGGRTVMGIAEMLKKHNCGKIYLAASHGVLNNGVDHLYKYFDAIYTTDSICELEQTDKLFIFSI